MNITDIPAGLSLCRSAGWNQLSRDWELFLTFSPRGCRVAMDDVANVVGTVTTIRYQDHFSWVGMVLVDPKLRKLGIGTQLLRESLAILKDEDTVKLDATPAGREVYLKLNFVDEYRLSRMHIAAVPANNLPASTAKAMLDSDLPAVCKLDNDLFGADRSDVLYWIRQSAPYFAYVLEEEKIIKGYCFGRPGYNFQHIGPVVCEDVAGAVNLVSAALKNCIGKPAIVDSLHHTVEWNRWLTGMGFTEQRPFVRMYKGSNAYPGIPRKQFAILGPEFG